MKTRIALTAIVILLAFSAKFVWNTVESPTIGAIDAAQANDTTQSYVNAKLMRENVIDNIIFFVPIIVITGIWLVPSRKPKQPAV